MKGHHSITRRKTMIIWFLSGRIVVDRYLKTTSGAIVFEHLGAIPVERLRRMSPRRLDRPLPPKTEVLSDV